MTPFDLCDLCDLPLGAGVCKVVVALNLDVPPIRGHLECVEQFERRLVQQGGLHLGNVDVS